MSDAVCSFCKLPREVGSSPQPGAHRNWPRQRSDLLGQTVGSLHGYRQRRRRGDPGGLAARACVDGDNKRRTYEIDDRGESSCKYGQSIMLQMFTVRSKTKVLPEVSAKCHESHTGSFETGSLSIKVPRLQLLPKDSQQDHEPAAISGYQAVPARHRDQEVSKHDFLFVGRYYRTALVLLYVHAPADLDTSHYLQEGSQYMYVVPNPLCSM